MNFCAWNHRCWLVSYMAREQVLNELSRSRNWACLHVADNSCFHYRTRLLLRILEESSHKQEDMHFNYYMEIYWIWQEELEWKEVLLRRYVAREALWLHRRFLSLRWIRHFATSPGDTSNHSENKASTSGDVEIFLDNELHLVSSCSNLPDNDFEDFQVQEVYSATYILWLMRQIPKTQGIELDKKLNTRGLKTMLNTACPERSSLWCHLAGYPEASVQGLEENQN